MTPQGLGGLDAGDVNFLRPALGGASQQEILRTIDIFNDYFQKANVPPEQGEKLIQAAVNGGSKFERDGNTVMAFKPLPPNAAQVYFFSVDRPEAFVQSMVKLISPMWVVETKEITSGKFEFHAVHFKTIVKFDFLFCVCKVNAAITLAFPKCSFASIEQS